MSEPRTARQRQTQAARHALAERFSSPEERSEHYRALGRLSAERRLVLSGDEASALADAYALLARIVARTESKANQPHIDSSEPSDPEVAA